MAISLRRVRVGDEVQMTVTEVKEANGNLSMKVSVAGSSTTIYHTFGSFLDKGRYFFERFLDAVNAPDEIDSLQWFVGKKFFAKIGEREWKDKKYMCIDEFIEKETSVLEEDDSPWSSFPSGDSDVTFYDGDTEEEEEEEEESPASSEEEEKEAKPVKKTAKKPVKKSAKKAVTVDNSSPVREDYTKLFEESEG